MIDGGDIASVSTGAAVRRTGVLAAVAVTVRRRNEDRDCTTLPFVEARRIVAASSPGGATAGAGRDARAGAEADR